jgi:hypothetical protein
VRIRLPTAQIAEEGLPNFLGGTSSSLASSGAAITSASGGLNEISESDEDSSWKRTIGRRKVSESLDASSDCRTWIRGVARGFRADRERFGSGRGLSDGRENSDLCDCEIRVGRGSSESEEEEEMLEVAEPEGRQRASVVMFARIVSWKRPRRSRKALISSMSLLLAIPLINGRSYGIECIVIHPVWC